MPGPRSPDHAIVKLALAQRSSERPLTRSEQRAIKQQADAVIYRNLSRLIAGGRIDGEMRHLLAWWVDRQLHPPRRGRPAGTVREMAIAEDVWEAIWLEPDAKRESIYTSIEQQRGIRRRRLLGILRRHPVPAI